MATTVYDFSPSQSSAFTFQPTLDGNPYAARVWFSAYRQDYMITVTTTQGDVVFTLPLIGSPNDYPISITAGYFATRLVYFPDQSLIQTVD